MAVTDPPPMPSEPTPLSAEELAAFEANHAHHPEPGVAVRLPNCATCRLLATLDAATAGCDPDDDGVNPVWCVRHKRLLSECPVAARFAPVSTPEPTAALRAESCPMCGRRPNARLRKTLAVQPTPSGEGLRAARALADAVVDESDAGRALYEATVPGREPPGDKIDTHHAAQEAREAAEIAYRDAVGRPSRGRPRGGA